MSVRGSTVLFTRDGELARRVQAALEAVAEVHVCASASDLLGAVSRLGPAVVLADLRNGEPSAYLPGLAQEHPDCVVVAFGDPRGTPALSLPSGMLFALLPFDADLRAVRQTCANAATFVRLLRENRWLRDEKARLAPAPPASSAGAAAESRAWPFLRALQSLERPDDCLREVVDGVASALSVARAGLFLLRDGAYRLAAAKNGLPEAEAARFAPDDPLAQWLHRQAHIVARDGLERIERPDDRFRIDQALRVFGAEVLAPILGRGRLNGWLFVGRRTGGVPFRQEDLETVAALADHAAAAVEHTLLCEGLAAQKAFADALLEGLPQALVTVDAGGRVRACNAAAARLFGPALRTGSPRTIEALDGRLADLARRAMAGEDAAAAKEWTDDLTGRFLAVRARRLGPPEAPLGAALVIEDLTEQRREARRREREERAAFWQELAAGMSHEIRNPLVAIKTFAQLLPRRYDDPAFRDEFRGLVTAEVERLSGMVDQIDRFARPPPLQRRRVDTLAWLRRVAGDWELRNPTAPRPRRDFVEPLPPLSLDETQMQEAVDHLLTNAAEAVAGKPAACVEFEGRAIERPGRRRAVLIRVRDNGGGIEPGRLARVFSPFFTTKPRGMGLGLPIARRAVLDHGGEIRIECEGGRTVATVLLPADEGESVA